MPHRTRRFLQELTAHAAIFLAGAAGLGAGAWAARQAWTTEPPRWWLMGVALALAVLGGLFVRSAVGGAWGSFRRLRSLPALRRPPTAREVTDYRACIERALAAIAAVPDPEATPLASVRDSLRREHAHAADSLRDPTPRGYHRWVQGELDLASWGTAYAEASAAIAAVSDHQARFGRQ